MVIHCIWVVGSHKRKDYGGMLLQKCIESAQMNGMDGVAVITIKKGGWSPKKMLFESHGFQKYDQYVDNYKLYALKLREDAPEPRFGKIIAALSNVSSFHVLTSRQCPYMALTSGGVEELGVDLGKNVFIEEMKNREDVIFNCMDPYGTFHVLLDGVYVTNLPGGPSFIKKTVEKILT
jgi:hypothetical protein